MRDYSYREIPYTKTTTERNKKVLKKQEITRRVASGSQMLSNINTARWVVLISRDQIVLNLEHFSQ